MLDLATATLDTFAPFKSQSFQVTGPNVSVSLELVEVRSLGPRLPISQRDPFVLSFRGAPGLRIPQRIYHFENPTLGAMEIFITQVADGPNGSEFEAVFN